MNCVVVEHKKLSFIVKAVLKVVVIECNKHIFVSIAFEGCGVGVLEYSRGAIYRGRYTASQAALGVLKISRSAIYRGR